VKQADLRGMFEKTSKGVCTSIVKYLLIPCFLLHQLLQLQRLQKTQKRTLMTLNQQMKISKWNTPLLNGTAQVQEQ
jgi:hypothetical protein